jgi:hypothetical protein
MLDFNIDLFLYYVIETIFNKTKTMLWKGMLDVSLFT